MSIFNSEESGTVRLAYRLGCLEDKLYSSIYFQDVSPDFLDESDSSHIEDRIIALHRTEKPQKDITSVTWAAIYGKNAEELDENLEGLLQLLNEETIPDAQQPPSDQPPAEQTRPQPQDNNIAMVVYRFGPPEPHTPLYFLTAKPDFIQNDQLVGWELSKIHPEADPGEFEWVATLGPSTRDLNRMKPQLAQTLTGQSEARSLLETEPKNPHHRLPKPDARKHVPG